LDKWRLIYLDIYDGYMQMAIDEAMMILKAENKIPNTLRLYQFNPSAITIGYFQSIGEEVNLDYCKRNGINVIRRVTGGGAVYHDSQGEITYSVVADMKSTPRDIIKCYEYICGGIVSAIKRFGLKAEFKPINDVILMGRKISGSAQTRRRRVILQHGTFMYNTDISKLAVALKIVPEKLKDKGAIKLEERVITLSKALGRKVEKEEVVEALIEGFAEALKVEFEKDNITREEMEIAERLAREKYSSRKWNFMV